MGKDSYTYPRPPPTGTNPWALPSLFATSLPHWKLELLIHVCFCGEGVKAMPWTLVGAAFDMHVCSVTWNSFSRPQPMRVLLQLFCVLQMCYRVMNGGNYNSSSNRTTVGMDHSSINRLLYNVICLETAYYLFLSWLWAFVNIMFNVREMKMCCMRLRLPSLWYPSIDI